MKREDIDRIIAELGELKCRTLKEVEEARVRFLGKKGEVTALFDEFHDVSKEMKKEFGRSLNELKKTVQAKIDELRSSVEVEEASAGSGTDLTMPGDEFGLGGDGEILIRLGLQELDECLFEFRLGLIGDGTRRIGRQILCDDGTLGILGNDIIPAHGYASFASGLKVSSRSR